MIDSQKLPLDIRQSPKWQSFLEALGWQSLVSSHGVRASLLLSPYGHVIKIQRPRPLEALDLEEISAWANKYKVFLVKLEPSLNQNLALLQDFKYLPLGEPLIPPSTRFIDLTLSKDALWKSLSHSCRYSIRRAYREGAHVKFFRYPDEDTLRTFYEIHKGTGHSQGFYVAPFKEYVKKVALFGPDAVLGLVYGPDGVPTGGNLYLGFGSGVWYMHGGTTSVGRKNRNGYVLYWESILHSKELGYTVLDLEGVDDPRYPAFTKHWGGLSHFKEKFGGVHIEFPPTYLYVRPAWARLLVRALHTRF